MILLKTRNKNWTVTLYLYINNRSRTKFTPIFTKLMGILPKFVRLQLIDLYGGFSWNEMPAGEFLWRLYFWSPLILLFVKIYEWVKHLELSTARFLKHNLMLLLLIKSPIVWRESFAFECSDYSIVKFSFFFAWLPSFAWFFHRARLPFYTHASNSLWRHRVTVLPSFVAVICTQSRFGRRCVL